METHSSVLAWRVPETAEPGGPSCRLAPPLPDTERQAGDSQSQKEGQSRIPPPNWEQVPSCYLSREGLAPKSPQSGFS